MASTQQLPLHFEFSNDQTFANFFSGSNQEIVEHLTHCVKNNGEQQIFIWGGKCLGKTHLLQACCHLAHQQHKSSFYLALNAQQLPDPAILDGLQEMAVVCCDNIDSIARNSQWEQAFFTFFNQLRDLGHCLILSASKPPNEIPLLLPDLKTRLTWGLVLHLQELTEEDSITALAYKARHLGFELSPQVGRFLITHYSRDLPSLWDLLRKLDHETLAAKRKLTIPFLKQIL